MRKREGIKEESERAYFRFSVLADVGDGEGNHSTSQKYEWATVQGMAWVEFSCSQKIQRARLPNMLYSRFGGAASVMLEYDTYNRAGM